MFCLRFYPRAALLHFGRKAGPGHAATCILRAFVPGGKMSLSGWRKFRLVVAFALLAATLFAETKPRARDLGVPFDGTPGAYNAITDVKGVEVGHTTLISGEGKLEVGKGPVRTGVTA